MAADRIDDKTDDPDQCEKLPNSHWPTICHPLSNRSLFMSPKRAKRQYRAHDNDEYDEHIQFPFDIIGG
jgi:hypothetical protein